MGIRAIPISSTHFNKNTPLSAPVCSVLITGTFHGRLNAESNFPYEKKRTKIIE